jgi:alpha-2-macroglobulin
MSRTHVVVIASMLGIVGVAAVAPLACGSSQLRPGLKVSASPTSRTDGNVMLVANFSRDMVKPEMVGVETRQSPLRISPPHPGRLEWVTTWTLTFHPSEQLPPSTRFTLEVPLGTCSLDGHCLREPYRFNFDTQRISGRAELGHYAGRNSSWGVPEQVVFIRFSHDVTSDEVRRACGYMPGLSGERIAVADLPVANPTSGTFFRVKPASRLKIDSPWTFRCEANLRGVQGTLGLEKAIERDFRTYAPLRLVSARPKADKEVDPDWQQVSLLFSNPMRNYATMPVDIQPPVRGLAERLSSDDNLVSTTASLRPKTRYSLRVKAEIEDAFGQRLGKDATVEFRTGNARPRVSMDTGQWVVEATRSDYVLWARNVSTINIEAARIEEERLPALLPTLNWYDDEAVDLDKLKIRSSRQRVSVKGRLNEWDQVRLDLPKLVGRAAAPTGFYYLAVQAPETARAKREAPHQEVLVNFTDLGVVSKLSPAAGMVWVTNLSTAQPVAGAQITIRDRKGTVKWRGKTSADGTAVTPGRATLLPPPKPAAGPEPGEHEEETPDVDAEERHRSNDNLSGLLIFVRSGQDLTFVDPLREGGLAAYNFKVSRDTETHLEKLRGFMHTDRGLYRPEDTVHIKGLARVLRLGKGLSVPTGAKVKVEIKDPRGNPLLDRTVPLTRFGGFSLDAPLPGDARLGDYVVSATLPQGAFSQTFSVEEYRPANFEVKGRSEQSFAIFGDRLRLRAEGRYFYGPPVRRGTLTWRVNSRPRRPSFASYSGYSFEDEQLWRDRYDSGQELVTEGKGKLDSNGQGTFALRVGGHGKPWDTDYLVEAEVKDETNQTIAARFSVPVHRSALHLGLALGGPVAQARRARKLRLVALDPEGKRIRSSAKLHVLRREWSCAYEVVGYRGEYRCKEKKITVLKKTVEIDATAPTEVAFTPPSAGEYWAILEGRDERRRPRVTSTELWVWGSGETAWRASDSPTFDIIPDKSSYRPGETAQLMLKTTLGKATGLLTIEREGVLERKLIDFSPDKAILEVPLASGHSPNVYASVVLVQARSGAGARGLPRLRMGMVNLPVKEDGKRLKVTVASHKPSYRPGETVRATVQVSDDAGKPVAAEVSLSAADEGVLSLIAYRTPDPIERFFAPWGLSVSTATQYDRLLQLPQPNQKRSATGGDGGKVGTMRSRFLGTAYWSPALVTDASGKATVTFAAPDNLTAFRLMAVAADMVDRFGSAEKRFTVAKPLQLVSALPRFLTVGDHAEGGVVIHNETGAAGRATVKADLEGLELAGPAQREVSVPVNGRVAVTFPVRARREGRALLRFALKMGAESDGMEVSLPVVHPSSPESALVAEGTVRDQAPAALALRLPEGALTEAAMVDVSVDPDGLAGIEEGLRALIEYPYGCLEQTTSRVIPLLMVQELARELAIAGLDGPALQRFLRIGIAKIGRHQTSEGGFSLWPNGQADAYLTAFALWGLHLAREAGHAVDAKRVDDGVTYLRRALASDTRSSEVHNELGDLGGRAFALHVLALLGKPEAQLATKLREDRARLPRFGKAFLARALGASHGKRDKTVKELLDELADAAEKRHGPTLIREPNNKDLAWYMSDDVRTTAIILDAFLALRPRHPVVPRLAKGLLLARRGGSWATTQDNLYALVALTRFAKIGSRRSGSVKVSLGGKSLLDAALDGAGVRIKRVSFPLADALSQRAPLKLETSGGGKIYYSARIRFRRSAAHQKARSAGMTLRHEYLDVKTGKAVQEARAGDVVRVRVTLVTPEDRHHLALSERLPAGLEAINMRLATSSGKAQADEDRSHDWRPVPYQEIRDDRVSYFTERLSDGVEVMEFLARATTAGTFVVPSANAEEMYQPEVMARTALRSFKVLAK